MSTYAIGDIQGCFTAFTKLLEVIQFDRATDFLWLTGDLVNRGPSSLETLRFVKNLGDRAQIVLGNHDLHLLARTLGGHPLKADDTLQPILAAPDRDDLIAWLRKQPLLQENKALGFIMVHAGLAPAWDAAKAAALAREVESVLQSERASDFFQNMYGNLPNQWDDGLVGWERLRCITNYFTRVRFCHPDGRLELKIKGQVADHPDLIPWFKVPERKTAQLKIIFGHWAALNGVTGVANLYALDTGCVWGGKLTALRLEDEERFDVSC